MRKEKEIWDKKRLVLLRSHWKYQYVLMYLSLKKIHTFLDLPLKKPRNNEQPSSPKPLELKLWSLNIIWLIPVQSQKCRDEPRTAHHTRKPITRPVRRTQESTRGSHWPKMGLIWASIKITEMDWTTSNMFKSTEFNTTCTLRTCTHTPHTHTPL